MTAIAAWMISDLAIVQSLKLTLPAVSKRERLLQELAAGMELAMPLDALPDDPIVFLDWEGRIAAYGHAHDETFMMLERMTDGKLLAHQVIGPIVRRGMWEMCKVVATMNSTNAWGSGGVSVSAMLQTLTDFERRMECS